MNERLADHEKHERPKCESCGDPMVLVPFNVWMCSGRCEEK